MEGVESYFCIYGVFYGISDNDNDFIYVCAFLLFTGILVRFFMKNRTVRKKVEKVEKGGRDK